MVKQRIPKKSDCLREMVGFYLNGPRFLALGAKSQYEYRSHLTKACFTTLADGRFLGDVQLQHLRTWHFAEAYEQWLEAGIRSANYRKAALSAAWKYGMQRGIVDTNPLSLVDTKSTKPRKVMWQREHVTTFLDVAYSDWRWRSIGLIVHMAYEWAQRVGDMRVLKWSSIDLQAQRLDLTQSKRNADVHLPISDGLTKMLVQQRQDFGFQKYVAPRVVAQAGSYSPYATEEIHKLINEVKTEANLPSELTAMDLRRTAITEMVEAGVDLLGVMQVSGHRNPQSVKPYLVNTFSGASAALAKRNGGKS